jgi:hypothetical protein
MKQNSLSPLHDEKDKPKWNTLPPTPPQRLKSMEYESQSERQEIQKGHQSEQQEQPQCQNYVDVATILCFSPEKRSTGDLSNILFRQETCESPIIQFRENIRRNQQLHQLQCSRHPIMRISIPIDDNDSDRVTSSNLQKSKGRKDSKGMGDSSRIICPSSIESVQSIDDSIERLLNCHQNPLCITNPNKKVGREEKNNAVQETIDTSCFEASVTIDFEFEMNYRQQEYENPSTNNRRNAPPRRRSTMSFSKLSSVSSITYGEDYDDDSSHYEYGYAIREEPIVLPSSSTTTTVSPRIVSPSTRRIPTKDFFGKQLTHSGGLAPKAPRRRSTLHYYFPDIDENVEQELKNTDIE